MRLLIHAILAKCVFSPFGWIVILVQAQMAISTVDCRDLSVVRGALTAPKC